MEVRPSILIVDDHPDIRDPLATYLRRFDFDVEAVADGKAMRQRLLQRTFNLIVLDVMLPGENGLSLCRHVSEHVGTPVVLLTAVAEQADKIAGLEVGADDYVVKPFDPRELVARIRSVLRRVHGGSAPEPDEIRADRKRFMFNGWTLDTEARELRNPQHQPVALGTAEFHLLRALLENPCRVLSRSQLLDLTQRTQSEVFDRSIDSQISRLQPGMSRWPPARRWACCSASRSNCAAHTSCRMICGPPPSAGAWRCCCSWPGRRNRKTVERGSAPLRGSAPAG